MGYLRRLRILRNSRYYSAGLWIILTSFVSILGLKCALWGRYFVEVNSLEQNSFIDQLLLIPPDLFKFNVAVFLLGLTFFFAVAPYIIRIGARSDSPDNDSPDNIE